MIGVGRARVMNLMKPSRPMRMKETRRARYSIGWRRPRKGMGGMIPVDSGAASNGG